MVTLRYACCNDPPSGKVVFYLSPDASSFAATSLFRSNDLTTSTKMAPVASLLLYPSLMYSAALMG